MRRPVIPGRLTPPTRWLLPLLLLGQAGCDGFPAALAAEDPGPAFELRAEDLLEADILPDPVAGELAGAPFALADAVFRVERMERRERVDLWLSDQEITECGVPLRTQASKVWLRFPGVTAIESGELRVGADEEGGPLSVHYERWSGRGWTSGRRGAALVLIDGVDAQTVRGRLSACFDDGAGSCVSGRFSARRCTGSLDVDDSVSGAGSLGRDRPRAGDVP